MSFNNDKGYARCKACDRRFYPQWRKDRNEFEELCWSCLPAAISAARTDSVLYSLDADGNPNFNPDTWEQSDTDQAFIDGYLMDKLGGASGDMLADDDYHMYGEGAMGDLGFFDSYE